jgi:putative peptidoglycan lipid II flippase
MRNAVGRSVGVGLLGALGIVGAGAAAVRVAAAVKDLVVAHRFGTGDAVEAFLMAFVLPIFLAGSFRSAFLASFVPRYLQAEARRGPEAAREILRRAVAVQLVLLAAVAGGLALAAGPVVAVLGRAFAPDKRELTRHFVVLLAPFVLLDGTAGIFTATLYARRRYAGAALVSALPPVVALAAVLVLPAAWGAGVLVVGVIAGSALEAVVSGALIIRGGWGGAPAFARPGPEEFALLRGFALLLFGGILMSANTVVDQAMAAAAGDGNVAALSYGVKIPAAVLGLVGVALTATTLPHYATFVAANRFREMGASLRKHATLLAAAGFAVAVPLALLSGPLVHLLFEHGSFGVADTARVAKIQALYAFQIPGFLVGMVAARCLNALGRDRLILAVSGVNFTLNIVGNFVLLRWIGVPGIALSTATVYTISAAVLLVLCRRAVRQETLRAQKP